MAVGWGAVIGAGASILGDVMSQQGQQQTNQMNQAEILQEEQWQTQMSDTAMQRRVADLKAANLNPLLAIGQGGASVPGVGMIPMQNPAQSMSQLGSQVTNAMQLQSQQSQIKANEASANRDNAAAEKSSADAAVTKTQLPYSGATAQMALSNMRMTNDALFYQAQSLERDFNLSQKSLPQLMEDPTFAAKMLELKQQAAELDNQRVALGMPRIENDATWQSAHPQLSGWLQSGTTNAVQGVVGAASQLLR